MLLAAVFVVALAHALPCYHKYKGPDYSCCLVPPTKACGAKCVVKRCRAQGTMFVYGGAYANKAGTGKLYYNCCKMRAPGTTPPKPPASRFKAVSASACWKNAYGRGVGKPVHTCRPGTEKSGLLCYPRCKKGYAGAGPVCWENCKNGFRDDGAFCAKPAAYGRGVGYPLWDKKRCEAGHGWSTDEADSESSSVARRLLGAPRRVGPKRRECEKNGLLWYPKCKPGFHNVACCICSPNCPAGQTDIGVSCAKRSYGRGWGVPMGCNRKSEELNGALCYPKCRGGYGGNGPLCWINCPKGWVGCGFAMCTATKEHCGAKILKLVGTAVTAVGAAATVLGAGAAVGQVITFAGQLTLPKCHLVPELEVESFAEGSEDLGSEVEVGSESFEDDGHLTI